jgi:hypothetical protein
LLAAIDRAEEREATSKLGLYSKDYKFVENTNDPEGTVEFSLI